MQIWELEHSTHFFWLCMVMVNVVDNIARSFS